MNNQQHLHSQAGFTLIELLVVTVLSILLMLSASAVLSSFLLNSAKTNVEQRIKQDGDLALSRMEYVIRNAKSLADNGTGTTCDAGMDALAVIGWDGETTTYVELDNGVTNKIASTSAIGDAFLTSDDYTVTDLQFDCSTAANGKSYVEIAFTLKWGASVEPDRNTSIVSFNSGVEIRN